MKTTGMILAIMEYFISLFFVLVIFGPGTIFILAAIPAPLLIAVVEIWRSAKRMNEYRKN